MVDAEGHLLFLLPLIEVLQTTRKRRRFPGSEALDRASVLLSRTKSLREALAQQIETTSQTIDRTRGLLRELHARGSAR